jgi:hypothetical protein
MPLRAKHQSKTVQRDQRSVRASGGLTHHGRNSARAENAFPRPSRQVLDRKRRGYAASQAPSKQASSERAWVVEYQGLNKEPRLRVGVWGITWGVSMACRPGSGIAPLVAKWLRRSIRCSSAYFTICIFYCEDLPWQNKAGDRDAYEKTQMNREKVNSRLFGRPCDCSIIATTLLLLSGKLDFLVRHIYNKDV